MDTSIETIVFGGGCFWCTEAVFRMVKGVESVVPGYAGGKTENPTYESVSGGETGHAEVVKIDFNSDEVDVDDLFTIFFGSHDPTTLNRQGADVGTQYRSAIFYTNEEQKEKANKFIEDINESNSDGDSVVTEVSLLKDFFEAENYHKDYFELNKSNPYCMVVINPKLKKVQKQYSELLKEQNE